MNFLDILFGFDGNKELQTNLYRKPTDARSYLNYNSCHPNYTFAGTVYSQALRIRRIVNDQNRFEKRLDELAIDFQKSEYPEKMIQNIIDKVKKQKRDLSQKDKPTNSGDETILAISTFGRDKKLTKILERVEAKSKNIKFKYVKKTAPSLQNLLVKSKHASLGHPHGATTACKTKTCMGCKLMSNRDTKQKSVPDGQG